LQLLTQQIMILPDFAAGSLDEPNVLRTTPNGCRLSEETNLQSLSSSLEHKRNAETEYDWIRIIHVFALQISTALKTRKKRNQSVRLNE